MTKYVDFLMVTYREDFKEIAHCGGRMSFKIVCDEERRISIGAGWTISSPKPATIVGIYADLHSGAVISDFRMGGIGQPHDPQPPSMSITIMLGSDSHEKWGHQCPRCKGYFRSAHHPAIFPLTCAYCGLRAAAHVFLTPAQRNYVTHCVDQVATCINELNPGEEHEVVIDMDKAGDNESSEPKPDFYYSELSQQTEFDCVKCGEYNDVRGRFAYCTTCGWKNNGEDLKAKLESIRKQMNAANILVAGAIRESVSEFDACCRDFAVQVRNRIPMKPMRKTALERSFYDSEGAAIKNFKEIADIDLMRDFSDGDKSFIKLMMHRRHVYEHLGGVADEKYVKDSGDPIVRVGDLLREDASNTHRLIGLLNRMVANMESDFHEIFPPTEWPVKNFEKFNERQKRL